VAAGIEGLLCKVFADVGHLCRDGDDDRSVPEYIERKFRRYLDCGIRAHGLARARWRSGITAAGIPSTARCVSRLLTVPDASSPPPLLRRARAQLTAAHRGHRPRAGRLDSLFDGYDLATPEKAEG